MKRLGLYVLFAFAVMLLAFGCGGAGTSSVTVTLSPADGSTDVAVNVAVTATFSGTITDPADWTVVFTLKKDNAGDSLCTDVTYDYANLVATCTHGDLEKGSSYTISISGLKDVMGNDIGTVTAAFSTLGLPTASLKLVRLDSTELDLSSTAIPRAVTIKVTFSRAPDASERTDIESGLALEQGGTALSKTLAWSTDFTQLTVTPDRWFEYGTTYTVDISGALATDVSETFTTVPWGDVNGDGYSDVIVGARNADGGGTDRGRAYIFLAGSGIADCDMSTGCTPDTTITGAADTYVLGSAVAVAGDVNADGYMDVAVGVPGANAWSGGSYVFLGSANGISDCDLSAGCTPHATISPEAAGDCLGVSVPAAGDVNGDGYDDIIVGAYCAQGSKGRAYVLRGSGSGIGNCDLAAGRTPDATITGDTNDGLGESARGAGDVNGDGYDDVIVGAPDGSSSKGHAYVFLGSGNGIGDCDLSAACTADTKLVGKNLPSNSELGNSVSSAGDVNGDGYDEVIVGAPYAENSEGEAYVLLGSANGISDCDLSAGCTPDTTIRGAAASDELGFSVSMAGDVNGDGYDDVFVGADGVSTDKGRAYVLLGSGSGISNCDLSSCTPDTTIIGALGGDYLGEYVSGAGDVNGDGYDDVIVGAPSAALAKGQAYVLQGSANGISDCNLVTGTPDTTLTGANANDDFGIVREEAY